ncbi:conserved hypothetical protein [Ricinus communis]|uniref:Uncharacterized protein n=1 Tax=Ricinus communis TaxID=3988 RepID=B9SIC5_RICCO|nr:conserved hypothetical protein [Ricinus communis]
MVIDDDDMDKDPTIGKSVFSNISGARTSIGSEENKNRTARTSSSISEATSNRENSEGQG